MRNGLSKIKLDDVNKFNFTNLYSLQIVFLFDFDVLQIKYIDSF